MAGMCRSELDAFSLAPSFFLSSFLPLRFAVAPACRVPLFLCCRGMCVGRVWRGCCDVQYTADDDDLEGPDAGLGDDSGWKQVTFFLCVDWGKFRCVFCEA